MISEVIRSDSEISIKDLVNLVSELSSKVNNLSKEKEEMSNNLNQMKDQLTVLTKEKEDLTNTMNQMENKIEDLTKEIKLLKPPLTFLRNMNQIKTGRSHRLLLSSEIKKLFAAIEEDILVFEFDEQNNKYDYITSLKGHKDTIFGLTKWKEKEFILSASTDSFIFQWNVIKYQIVFKFKTDETVCSDLFINQSNGDIFLPIDKGRMMVWDDDLVFKKYIPIKADRLMRIKDGRILVWHHDGFIQFLSKDNYEIDINHKINDVEFNDWINDAMLYEEEKNHLILGLKGKIKIIDLNTYTVIKTIQDGLDGRGVYSISKLIGGGYIVGLDGSKNQLQKFNEEFNYEKKIKYPYKDKIRVSITVPNSKKVIMIDNEGTLTLWESA